MPVWSWVEKATSRDDLFLWPPSSNWFSTGHASDSPRRPGARIPAKIKIYVTYLFSSLLCLSPILGSPCESTPFWLRIWRPQVAQSHFLENLWITPFFFTEPLFSVQKSELIDNNRRFGIDLLLSRFGLIWHTYLHPDLASFGENILKRRFRALSLLEWLACELDYFTVIIEASKYL